MSGSIFLKHLFVIKVIKRTNKYTLLAGGTVATIILIYVYFKVGIEDNFLSEIILVLCLALFFLPFAFRVAYERYYLPTQVKQWVAHKRLTYYSKNCYKRVQERFLANTKKDFFGAKRMKPNIIKYNTNYFIEGRISGRPVYIYPLVGRTYGKLGGLFYAFDRQDAPAVFYGHCVEIGINEIPGDVILTRKNMGELDTIDTESGKFEKMYNINSPKEASVLQLFEPSMIDLINHIDIAAIEFSDCSIIMYYTLSVDLIKKFNSMLYWGLKIADQIDRNFPLNKYEKK